MPTYPFIQSTVLAPAHYTAPTPSTTPIDKLSYEVDHIGFNTCGSRTFTISLNNTKLNAQNGITIDSRTGVISLSPIYNN